MMEKRKESKEKELGIRRKASKRRVPGTSLTSKEISSFPQGGIYAGRHW
jgi:hypothetical protein